MVLAHVTAEQSYALLDSGRREDALEPPRYAHGHDTRRLPGLLRSWLFTAEGAIHSALGNQIGARKALDQAPRHLPTDPANPELPFLMLDETHLARRRGHCLARLGSKEAVESLHAALDGMRAATLSRAEAGLRVDLAFALTAQEDTTEARKHAQRAAELTRTTGSARQRARIIRLLGA